ncbi:GCN5 family N-acetyltransferase [Phaeobacter gallaeciensis]|uniref:GCN5 family N-acetyltransferase n=1 Tax=Phaeobacter gallaeciensis TaxID=60890 RepID=A0A1B0ZQB7_9RHOB|nr:MULTISPECIES: GNAT family protein [Phaeobacter]ANP36356.1 GCN5 family N-acetyltransferase [Phaeobacter gallaeciensis]MDE4060823.1 GNAT family protein [Phaeobacter gallaeciensis]MDE4123750.1 GNAT family protein [Phaeobacter gallaeciensis]MDE4128312.1 GNAT family protein [Phaeobacter gallaeciensis]PVZ46578.1 N-acetyltransferase [Phaeobacter sp. JL2872]
MPAPLWMTASTLTSDNVTLAPLTQDHAADLAEAAGDGALHRLWYTAVPAPDRVPAEINRRLALQKAGSMVPFAILDPQGRAVGMTTYMNIDHGNRRVEIGSTWYRKSVQRTGINTACKLMMLRHAFEDRDAIAVEFRTHRLNRQSRAAIERLGAQLDGILRAHMIMPDGSLRDSAVYSITAADWPAVRANLEFMTQR